MRLYLYCLSDDLKVAPLETVAGIAESAPRVIDLGAIKAIVSDVHIHQVRVTRENALAHERVIDCVMAETTPIPFRFGVVVNLATLQSYVEANEASLLGLLDRVRGAVEMNVKIIWDRDAAGQRQARTRQTTDAREAEGAGAGLRFLLRKRQEMAVEQALKGEAESIAAWLNAGVCDLVRESVVSLNPEALLVVSAAHMVERGRVREYRERVNSLSRERNDLRFLTSGAWPPYSFTHPRS
jgi:hypothetical protein